jgi:hypothetical protein
MSVAETNLIGPAAYSLTVIRGCFGTTIADHHADDQVFIIPLASLTPIQHPHFLTGNTAAFKLTLGAQQVSDVTEFDVTFTGGYSPW